MVKQTYAILFLILRVALAASVCIANVPTTYWASVAISD